MLRIAHIINPVKVKVTSDLFIAQPITFESMRQACRYAELCEVANVSLFTAQFSEDRTIIPSYFSVTGDLERSILDIGNFKEARKLPLIADILSRLKTIDAEYFVYTNVDIGLMPHFYVSVAKYIADGYEAFAINRRTIPEQFASVDALPYIYAQIGEIHQGYDCFIFTKQILQNLVLGNVTIGAPGIGLAFFVNLFCLSKKFILLDDHHLTFHIGNDRRWDGNSYSDYKSHNKKELIQIYDIFANKKLPVSEAIAYHKSFLVKNNFEKNKQRNFLKRLEFFFKGNI